MTDLLYKKKVKSLSNEDMIRKSVILYYQIPSFVIDKVRNSFGWTQEKSMRVQVEYLRFLYLRELIEEKLWIPDKVMGFWRIHRKIGHDYRTRFAALFDGQIPRKLEHPVENIEEVYQRTMKYYQSTFDEYPPLEIWDIAAGLSEKEDKKRKLINQYKYFTFSLGFLLVLKTAGQSNGVIAIVFVSLFIIYFSLMRL